jgi:hypothetical protein
MSISATGSSVNAYQYLQSLLQQQGSASSSSAASSSDPISELLSAFYPNGQSGQSSSATGTPGTTSSADSLIPVTSSQVNSGLSPNTMASLISMQGQSSDPNSPLSAKVQSLFSKMDTNSDGQVSKSEFENMFGAGADKSKVDGLFNALDSNGDGAVSETELMSAAQTAQAHHHHGHGGGDATGGGLSDLLSASGGTSQTATNADGSSTTTISYSDGSKVTMTTAASASSGNGSGTQNSATGKNSKNILEQLIQYQSQMLAQSTSAAPTSLVSAA